MSEEKIEIKVKTEKEREKEEGERRGFYTRKRGDIESVKLDERGKNRDKS